MARLECLDGPLKGLRPYVRPGVPCWRLYSPLALHNVILAGAVKDEDVRVETYEVTRLGLRHVRTDEDARPGKALSPRRPESPCNNSLDGT